jgi:hypothetical protein
MARQRESQSFSTLMGRTFGILWMPYQSNREKPMEVQMAINPKETVVLALHWEVDNEACLKITRERI